MSLSRRVFFGVRGVSVRPPLNVLTPGPFCQAQLDGGCGDWGCLSPDR